MTLAVAAQNGLLRIRRPGWDLQTYLRIHLYGKRFAPFGDLWDRNIQNVLGFSTPQRVFLIGDGTDDYEPYTGEPDSDDMVTET